MRFREASALPLLLLPLLAFAAPAAAHGGGTFTFVPTGGPTDPTGDARGGEREPGPTTPSGGGGGASRTTGTGAGGGHGWRTWWGYHREFFFARAMQGPGGGADAGQTPRAPRGKFREETLLPLLRQALEDKEFEVRSAAAVAIGKLGGTDYEDDLLRHVSRPPEGHHHVREGAIYGLGLLRDPSLRLRFRNLAGDRERPFRERGLALVGLALDRSDESYDLLLGFQAYLHRGPGQRGDRVPVDGEEEKRRFATHLLAFTGRRDAEPLLWSIATDPGRHGWPSAGLAVTALGRIGARDRIDGLLGLLDARGTEWEVRRSVPIALGLMLTPADEGPLRRLARAVREDRDAPTRDFATMALGAVGGEIAAGLLLDLRRAHASPQLSERCFLALALGLAGRNHPPAAEALFEDFRETGNLELRGAQALALGLARHGPGLDLTLERVREGSAGAGGGEEFLRAAALAMGFHRDPRALGAVRGLLDRFGHRSIRESAAIALALIRGCDAAEELVDLLRNGNSVTDAAGAVAALGLIPELPDEAIRALIAVYRSDRMPGETRAAAIVALGAIADDRPVPFSALLASGYNYFIRCLALDEIATYL